MKLVIVESPTKARTIEKFLGKDYEIKASMGHVIDLPKSKIGIDFEHDFMPLYEIVADKKQIISELKSSAKKASSIILATDPDREGEAIAQHVAEVLMLDNRNLKLEKEAGSLKKKSQASSFKIPVSRIVFHEITKEAIDDALQHPREINHNLVDAQTARRVLDRIVGYKLSPLLWKKVRRGLSAGRVQSVALRLIVEREREIEKFKKEPFFTITAFVKKGNIENIPFELIEINNEKIEIQQTFKLYNGQYTVTKTIIEKEKDAQKILDDLSQKTLKVSDILEKESRRYPHPPYTTSTLQQDAARRLGLNGRKTMSLAQKLYEEGYITYHRTDSVTIGSNAMFAIINFVKKEYGEKYVPDKPRFYSTKQKLAQEAHEAIRPTRVQNLESTIQNSLGKPYANLYGLIWRRAVASQMSDAVIESTTVLADVEASKNYRFKASGSVLVFDGFLKVNPLALQDNRLPEFEKGETLKPQKIDKTFHETLPPPRYNDASLIKSLEEEGIGRPSTYAAIISTIESRQYIERGDSAGSGRAFGPTAIGIAVNDFLVKNFSDIDDIPFTAEMEDSLDAIAHGQKEWIPMMKDFYSPFEKKLTEVEGAERVKIAVEQTGEKCPNCKKGDVIIRTGRFGKFLSCSRFPECKFTKTYVETTNLTCPKDGAHIVIKKTKRGRRFYGCSNYPACTFAAWKIEDIKNEQPAQKV